MIMTINPCRLCGELKELHESHIQLGFVSRWMKETSATGYLSVDPVCETAGAVC